MKLKQKQILKILLVVAIINVISIEFLLAEIPERVYYGNKIGLIVSRLSLGYISSYIFYLVVVVMKQQKDKKNIYGAVYNITERLIHNGYSVYDFVMEAAGEDPKSYDKLEMTKEEYLKFCERADLSKFPKNKVLGTPVNNIKIDFANFIYTNSVTNVNFYSDRVFTYMSFLDTDFVKLINNLHHTIFYIRFASSLTMIVHNPGINPNIAKAMYDYFDIIRQIDKYNKANHKKYLEKVDIK